MEEGEGVGNKSCVGSGLFFADGFGKTVVVVAAVVAVAVAVVVVVAGAGSDLWVSTKLEVKMLKEKN